MRSIVKHLESASWPTGRDIAPEGTGSVSSTIGMSIDRRRRIDGWNSFLRKTANSAALQQILILLLFLGMTTVLLFYPLDRPLAQLRHPFGRGFYPELPSDVMVWALVLSGLIWLWRLVHSRKKNLQLVFSRYVLFLFVLFFTIERFASSLFRGYLFQREWIQLASAIIVTASTVVMLPRLRSLKDSMNLAQRDHARFLAAMESSLDDFYIFDGVPDASGQIVDFRFSYINPNAERRLHVRRESLIGKILTEVRPFMITSGLIGKYREVVRTGIPFTCEVFIDDEMIKATWLNVQVVKLGEGIAITSRDITERKRLADHVQYLAHYDQLTGLANRTLLQDRLGQAILRARRYRHKVALFVLDIDYFKQINDSLGHSDGDALLAAVGERLAASVRETDTVARMGGDEFVIVMPDFKDIEEVRRCGMAIVAKAAQPILLNEREIQITVSVGISIFPDNADGEKDLFKNADAAMYAVKETGRNGMQFFGEDGMRHTAGTSQSLLGASSRI